MLQDVTRMSFIHAVDPAGDYSAYACLNLANTGQLFSSDAAGLDPSLAPSHRPMRDMPVDQLRLQPPAGALSPVAVLLSVSAYTTQGISLTFGDGRLVNSALAQYRADIEIELESIRREIAPSAPSRLSCLWVAIDSADGRKLISEMFGNEVHVLRVQVVGANRVHRADVSYYDSYVGGRREEDAVCYWKGYAASNSPRWEFLIDGVIEAQDQGEIARLVKAHISSGAAPWSGDNPPPKELIELASSA